jgi:sugar O-acyltransferase (sialic acid O-acetyltransferase NeuD family)
MMKTKKLIIVGDSAFAEIAREYFEVDTNYEVVAFSVESAYLNKEQLQGLPVVPFEILEQIYAPKEYEVFVAITYTQLNRLRARLASVAKGKGYTLASYISPRAFVWRNVKIGEHCFIFEDNTVQPFVKIGNNVVLWSGNHIGHHSVIRDNGFISSHVVISGFCDIGENSFLGVNCTLANNVTVGKDNWIGPGVTISRATEPGALFSAPVAEPSRVSSLRFFKIKEQP